MSENKEEFDSIRYALSKKYVKEETQYMIDSSNYQELVQLLNKKCEEEII